MKVYQSLAIARELAERMRELLEPHCERMAIAGSIRRGAEPVGDIELVAIPRMNTDLLGQVTTSQLDPVLADLVDAGELRPGRIAGPRAKNFLIPMYDDAAFALDLFLVTADTWGVQFAIRTGPRGYSQALVTERSRGGLLEDGLCVRDGRVWRKGVPLATPEEGDFLRLTGGWLDPAERWNWRRLRTTASQRAPNTI